MTKFKVGDKVRRISDSWPGTRMQVGSEWIIAEVRPSSHFLKLEGFSGLVYDGYFQLITSTPFPLYSEEQAVKLLTERGYEVKAPPEPLKGKGVVYEYYSQKGVYHFINKDIFDTWPNPNSIYRIVAIVDWTEGQGI